MRTSGSRSGAAMEQCHEMLEAPEGNQLIVFDGSAHASFMEEPERFNLELVRIKKETYPGV